MIMVTGTSKILIMPGLPDAEEDKDNDNDDVDLMVVTTTKTMMTWNRTMTTTTGDRCDDNDDYCYGDMTTIMETLHVASSIV